MAAEIITHTSTFEEAYAKALLEQHNTQDTTRYFIGKNFIPTAFLSPEQRHTVFGSVGYNENDTPRAPLRFARGI